MTRRRGEDGDAMELSVLDEDRWGAGEHTGHWWAQARTIRERVLRLPFLRQLADGSLDPGAFAEYLQQDAFYLAEYSRALALLAAKAPSAGAGAFWAGSAHTAVEAEQALHGQLLSDPLLANLPRPQAPSPTTRGYMHSLVAACAVRPYAVGAAAVLPCFWIYAEVGLALSGGAQEVAEHPFRRWVAEYGDPEFAASARGAVALVEEAAREASAPMREQMREAFLDACRWEELFWDAAHRREVWTR